MKIIGQAEDGRIVLDGEMESICVSKPIPGDSPMYVCNFMINIEGGGEPLPIIDPREVRFSNPKVAAPAAGRK